MTVNNHIDFEQKVGFDRVRRQVEELCTTPAARARLAAETFTTSAAELRRRLGLADELRQLLLSGGGFPGGEFSDPSAVVSKARVEGSFLEVDELRTLHSALTSVDLVLAFIAARTNPNTDRESNPARFPLLGELGAGVESFPTITAHIDTLIDGHGNIKDSASPELHTIRRTIRSKEGDVSKRMHRILSQAVSAGVVSPDTTLSIREGRTVIPVAAANKKRLPGFIHDESGSGKTFYIEPVEIVQIGNEIRELQYDERREIVRILTSFTDTIRPSLDGIATAGNYLTHIDSIRAKALWSIRNGAVRPIVSDDGRLVLRQARHPLLAQALAKEKKELVPLDVSLSKAERILVISGPNAGGKSVCLKTIALLQHMFQCGFPIPVLENSELPVFDRLFIDIGDEQSIDNDLSTYSSHLLNMKRMVREADDRSMFFIDEFGSGTEPVMGGAIAESVLERLVEKGPYGVVTTHYSNIKYFATNHPGVTNGAMAFDVQQIKPLFKLIQSEPGSSFAVEIARKIGLPEDIIRSASAKAGSDHIDLERSLRDIARDRRYWESKRDKIRLADRRVEEMEADYAARLSSLKAERSDILRTARAEALEIVKEANRLIENTIREIKQSSADKDQTRRARRKLETFTAEKLVRQDPDAPLEKIPHFEIGSKVVRKGGLVSGGVSDKKLNFSPRLDVRGMRSSEAVEAVEEFIDTALMMGAHEVSILHGKGTGALKSEIRGYLRTIPAVEAALDDHADRGGAGITVVTFTG